MGRITIKKQHDHSNPECTNYNIIAKADHTVNKYWLEEGVFIRAYIHPGTVDTPSFRLYEYCQQINICAQEMPWAYDTIFAYWKPPWLSIHLQLKNQMQI